MEKRSSLKFFYRFLILTIITFILVGVSVVLTSFGSVGIIIGGILVIINVFFLLFSLIVSITNLIKHILHKNKEYFDILYVINFLFALLITAVFLTFYFMILAGAMILLAPLL